MDVSNCVTYSSRNFLARDPFFLHRAFPYTSFPGGVVCLVLSSRHPGLILKNLPQHRHKSEQGLKTVSNHNLIVPHPGRWVVSLLVWEQRSLSSQRRPVWRWGLVWCVAQECEEGKPQGRSRSWERVGVTTSSCSPEGVKLQVRISNRMMGVGVAKRLRLSSSGVLETVPEKRLRQAVASGEEQDQSGEAG